MLNQIVNQIFTIDEVVTVDNVDGCIHSRENIA